MDQTDQVRPRVWLPGEALPIGVYVIGPEGGPARVEFSGARVDPDSPHALVEVVVPDYAATIAAHPAAPELAARAERRQQAIAEADARVASILAAGGA